jgi:uncharacterized protein
MRQIPMQTASTPLASTRSWRTVTATDAGNAAVIYLDTSAAVKLVRQEEHSEQLSEWLEARNSRHVLSSVLIEAELLRATRRSAPGRVGRAVEVLDGIGVITVSPAIVARAARYEDPLLRSLDAIHLATAQHVHLVTATALDAFVAYDTRLLDAAEHLGIPIAAPGQV